MAWIAGILISEGAIHFATFQPEIACKILPCFCKISTVKANDSRFWPVLATLQCQSFQPFYLGSMKKILFLAVLLFFSFAFVHAQGNSGNNGNGNGNGNSQQGWNGGNGNNPWANINAPQWLLTWLQNGGQVPMPLAVMVIHEARTWGQQNFGLNQGQMLVKYLQGQLSVDFLYTSPPSLTFRVSYLNGNIIIVLDDF